MNSALQLTRVWRGARFDRDRDPVEDTARDKKVKTGGSPRDQENEEDHNPGKDGLKQKASGGGSSGNAQAQDDPPAGIEKRNSEFPNEQEPQRISDRGQHGSEGIQSDSQNLDDARGQIDEPANSQGVGRAEQGFASDDVNDESAEHSAVEFSEIDRDYLKHLLAEDVISDMEIPIEPATGNAAISNNDASGKLREFDQNHDGTATSRDNTVEYGRERFPQGSQYIPRGLMRREPIFESDQSWNPIAKQPKSLPGEQPSADKTPDQRIQDTKVDKDKSSSANSQSKSSAAKSKVKTLDRSDPDPL